CINAVVRAQTSSSAETFVRSIYAEYSRSDPGPNVLGPKADKYFTPSLVNLVRRDQAATPQGYVGKLDFDPLCACQDADGLKLININLTPATADKIIAYVTINFSKSAPTDNKTNLRLTLAKVAGHWRVDDVAEEGKSGLRRLLSP